MWEHMLLLLAPFSLLSLLLPFLLSSSAFTIVCRIIRVIDRDSTRKLDQISSSSVL